jgi:PPP family 3-phenylpropionic acid transporter
MRLIGEIVPRQLAATAQAVYGTLCVGAMSALLTLASGPLYARFGASGFWVMAGLCVIALPATLGLRRPNGT